MAQVLFSTPVGPYDTHYYNQSLTDVMDQRFSRGCGIFTMRGHIHINFAHILAQNISAPSVFLEYPSWEEFDAELRRAPTHVGIHGFHNQRDVVIAMCKRARELAPRAKILLGGWSGVAVKSIYPESQWKAFADAICTTEGIRFMRAELGEPVDTPINVTHLPRCSTALPWIDPHPPGDMGAIVASLGCPHGCDFCGTTHMFDKSRIRLLSAHQTFTEMKRYFRENDKLISVNLIEEDTFADRAFVTELGQMIQQDREFGLERLNFFCLASNSSLSKFDFDDIVKTGVSSVFIGVESKFAPGEGYKKRDGRGIEETFRELHRRGISTIGAWMCGFDFQTRDNMEEDLQSFVALEPTFQQLTRLCPFPGTPLWENMAKDNRIDPQLVPAEAISFFGGGGLKPKHFHDHEVMEIVERGYTTLYETWGACMFRQWKVSLNGYEYCLNHGDSVIRRRAQWHDTMAREMYPLMRAMEVYAPNNTVRKHVRDQRARYVKLFGAPSFSQRMLEKLVVSGARKATKAELETPSNMHPKQEPFKRYEYHKREVNGERPYVVTHPGRELEYRLFDASRRARGALFSGLAQAVDSARRLSGRPRQEAFVTRRRRVLPRSVI